MNKQEILKQIGELLPDEMSEPHSEKLLFFLKDSIKNVPACNKCGALIGTDYSAAKVAVSWGYQSTGKDGDHDKWNLCNECRIAFEKEFEPICSMCQKSIVEVMANLYFRNPHCTFYGDYEGALEHYRTTRHCGLEFAMVSGRIVCEICYEKLISEFKLPILRGSYDFWNGDFEPGEGEQPKNRIDEALAFELDECATAHYFRSRTSWEDTLAIRKCPDKDRRFINLRYRREKPEFIARLKTKHPERKWDADKISGQTGDNKYVEIPVSWLHKKLDEVETTGQLSALPSGLDLTKLEIIDYGKMLKIGCLCVTAEEVLDELGTK